MDLRRVIDLLVAHLENEPSVEGAFLAGSLVNENRDEYSDVDLGVASADSQAAFEAAYALRGRLLAAVGEPVHAIERGWGHCQMVAALYGKSAFPPVGLEVDVVFSQLQHVGEQMPYAPYEVVFDRAGRLKPALDGLPRQPPSAEVKPELEAHMRGFPFAVHDALKAHGRGDSFCLQAVLEGMRQAIFHAAAARDGVPVYGAKRAYRHLSAFERRVIEDSYRDNTERSVQQLTRLYTNCLSEIQSDYQIEAAVEHLQNALLEIL